MTEADPTDPAPQLVLVGGPGGAGTSRAVAALADRLAHAGHQVALADLEPWNGASSRLTHAGVEVLAPSGDDAIGPVSAMLDRVGLDPRLAAEAAGLSGADVGEILHRLSVAHTRPDLEVVLVDLGSRIVETVGLADRLPWLATHLLRAQRGWLSSTRPRAASLLSRWPGADGHAAAQRFAARTSDWAALIRAADAVLIGEPDDPRLRRLRLGLALHEMQAPEGVRAEDVGAWQDLPTADERSVVGLTADGDGWAWRLALPGLRSQELRVDRSGDDLALDVLGIRRLVPLPSALRHFRTAGARVTAGHLEITFVPKESKT